MEELADANGILEMAYKVATENDVPFVKVIDEIHTTYRRIIRTGRTAACISRSTALYRGLPLLLPSTAQVCHASTPAPKTRATI